MSFPKDFIWGAASSAYQIEGGWNSDDKGRSIWDDFCHTGGNIKNGETGDIACDAYHRFTDDVMLMKQIGLSAYRFSVSWPRILPDGRGKVNDAGLAYYDRLVDRLLESGITPYLTLFHWDLPSALQLQGGWLSRATADAFGEYAALIAKHFDGRVKNYITINEPQCIVWLGHANGLHAPGLKLPDELLALCAHNVLLAHGQAVRALRENSRHTIEIGLASTGKLCYPSENDTQACDAAYDATFALLPDDWMFTHTYFLDAALLGRYPDNAPEALHPFIDSVSEADIRIISEKTDFIGANVYNGRQVDAHGADVPKHAGYPRTALKWPITPEVMRYGTRFLHRRYQLPILITENGLSCNDRVYLDGDVHDADRIDFLHRYLLELQKACADGVPIRGYMHWCFTDNFEWNEGYDERFGLVYVDFRTQQRILKDSAAWYSKTIQTNGPEL